MEPDFPPVWAGWTDTLRGTPVTVEVTAAALMLGCMLGLLIGIGWLNPRRRFIYSICTVYVTFIRGTPLPVQLFLLFFELPQFDILLPVFVCGVLGLGVYSDAYASEIAHGAVQLVDRGQMEAARSIGMSPAQSMRAIVLPQVVVRMISSPGNEFIALIKNSVLVLLLTAHDLIYGGQKAISVSYRSLEVYLAITLVYLVLTSATGYLLHQLERNIRAGGMVQ